MIKLTKFFKEWDTRLNDSYFVGRKLSEYQSGNIDGARIVLDDLKIFIRNLNKDLKETLKNGSKNKSK